MRSAHRHPILATISFLAAILLAASAVALADAPSPAFGAYAMRMNGKADEARKLLEDALAKNPSDAVAHYELARTLVWMALGDPNRGKLMDTLGVAQQEIAHAEAIDPGNVIYPLFDGHIALMQLYPSLMGNQSDTRQRVERLCGTYDAALKLKADDRPAMLYLVEIDGLIPADSGGDRAVAERYTHQLEKLDPVYGAKARSILLGDDNNVQFWKPIEKQNPNNAEVLEELGKAYLRADKVDDAAACFDRAMQIDQARSYLLLDLRIHYTWIAMQAGPGSAAFRSAAQAGEAAIDRYLATSPPSPLQAYALGVKSKYARGLGRADEAARLLQQAKSLEPIFPKPPARRIRIFSFRRMWSRRAIAICSGPCNRFSRRTQFPP